MSPNHNTPPPPPPPAPRSKISPSVLKLKSTLSDHFWQPPKPSTAPAPTGPYFVYGTLTNPTMISEILNLEQEPEFRPAMVSGYRCKMWGQYPALVGAPDAVVKGLVYNVVTREHAERLAEYETNSYRAESCLIMYTDGGEPREEMGYTFKFVGNPRDLSEGGFDITAWLMLIGRHDVVEKMVDKKAKTNDT
ncbi:hypothetical protein BDV25DRAFT_10397 [Aspergillus avenaceus]|uniref:Putative gamma-glutamylcyclotransferase n=1 Tax=Aspergillus avenaceus TaxID=36643 RepID=A0A5N6TR92_ASPAV|nr:hypothetical protein BDV25DRAFT_10397 [Aspergillus avenaceus]